MRFVTLLLVGLLLLSAGCQPITPTASLPADSGAEAGAGSALVFANVRVFDGEELIPNATVVVQDGIITAVGEDIEIPEGAAVIDGSGKTLLPGLIDAHTHVFTEDALRQALVFGVTTELDMFMDHTFAAQLREAQTATGATDRADLFSAGILATAPNGHGTQFGLPIPTLTEASEAEVFVDERVAEGSDYIKIVLESGEEMGFTVPTLDQATVDALVQAAAEHGKLSVVHVQTLEAAQMALDAGANGLAHIFSDAVPDAEFVDQAVANNLFVVPTLAVFQHIGNDPTAPTDTSITEDPHLAPYLTVADLQSLGSPYSGFPDLSLQNALDAVRLLFEAGVPILAGTDAANPGTVHGASLHRELELLTEAGLSPMDALAAATSVTADIFSLSDRGRIAPGLRGDLLLVNGDPTEQITSTRDIVGVWKLGVEVDRAAYLADLEAQRTASAEQSEAFAAGDVALVTDFESQSLASNFGSDWEVTIDQAAGGNSTAELEIVADGALDSNYSLLVTGEVGSAVPFAWAGVSYMPGPAPFAPFNVSSKPTLTFWAKGEGQIRLQVFCENVGQVPPEEPIPVTSEWQEFTFDLSNFGGCNHQALQALIFSAGPTPGEFSFQIDEVSFR